MSARHKAIRRAGVTLVQPYEPVEEPSVAEILETPPPASRRQDITPKDGGKGGGRPEPTKPDPPRPGGPLLF